jgi:ribosome biogenesis protein Nip4
MMRIIGKFVGRFGTSIDLDKDMTVERGKRLFLLNDTLKNMIRKDFFYAGIYLGKIKNDAFFPSFNLLSMIAETKANKVIVDEKAGWLFICGRDVFKQGIVNAVGSKRKGGYTLVLNGHGECLGFGRILHNLDEEKRGVIVKNISDIGDFLRRERQRA